MGRVLDNKQSLATFLKYKLRTLFYKAEVDRSVFFGILAKIWGVAAAPLIALLIVVKFSPLVQGYYYTFGSLLLLQTFVELGLSTVIIQFASHEWSKLKIDSNGEIAGDKEALSRLASLAKITSRWYTVGGAIIAFGLGLGGYIFFSQSQNHNINWVLPWFSLCFLTGTAFCIMPIWSLLEGCNQISAVYTYRFFQGIVASAVIWLAIFFGAKLWAAAISSAATVLCAAIFLKYRYLKFIKSLMFAKPSDFRIDWRKEILPMQWRIALSWISGYFIFSLFTPVIFHYYGPVIAGQFGMTWTVIAMVSSISSSWLYPKVPRFGMLIAEKRYTELDSLFFRVGKMFSIVTVLAAIAIWYVIYAINKLNHPLAHRQLPVLPATIFLIAQVIMMLSVPFSVYLRAHKKEPILFVSILCGALTALVTLIFGRYYSVTAIGLGYLVINIVIAPFIVLIWQRCRIEWHADRSL